MKVMEPHFSNGRSWRRYNFHDDGGVQVWEMLMICTSTYLLDQLSCLQLDESYLFLMNQCWLFVITLLSFRCLYINCLIILVYFLSRYHS